MNKILLNMEDISRGDFSPIIIRKNTGVFYTVQAGGILCTHPEVEGFYLRVFDYPESLSSCDYFCSNYMERIDEFIEDFNKKFINYSENLKMKIDKDKIDELQEGFIPIRVYYKDFWTKTFLDWVPGVTTDWNCD